MKGRDKTSGRGEQRTRPSAAKGIPVSMAAALVALGVVYGDLGTSPVYMTKAVVSGQGGLSGMTEPAVLGMLSLVIWTLTLITTVKYVLVAMRANNHGEGGIFALYTMVRRYGRYLALPAMLGGAAFLADSILTPAVSITSAVEGLRSIPAVAGAGLTDQGIIIAISVLIILGLFMFQRAGTKSIGRLFGPIMTAWFALIAVSGIANLASDWSVLRAFNPLYALQFLASPENHAGFAILGSVFLTVTGAEALYSDIGHVGRGNIYVTWPLVKIALILNYLGQGAWILSHAGDASLAGIDDLNPFFQMAPYQLRPMFVVASVVAGVIASQALVSGAFTLVAEAARLNWMPRMRSFYPSETMGQIYIPFLNWFLCVGVIAVIAFFRTSHNMEAAYGLALTMTMLSTTVLLTAYVWRVMGRPFAAAAFAISFGAIEACFFVSSLAKFFHGGYVTAGMTVALLAVMLAWHEGTRLERSQRRRVRIADMIPAFDALSRDESLPLMADNIVYLTPDTEMDRMDRDIVYSVFANRPRRAKAYWIVTVDVSGNPFKRDYSVKSFGNGRVIRVRMKLGYKEPQNVRNLMGIVMHDLVTTGEVEPQTTPYPDFDDPEVGDVRYAMIRKVLLPDSDVKWRVRLAIQAKYAIRTFIGSPIQWYGLDMTEPIVDTVPMFVRRRGEPPMRRVRLKGQSIPARQAQAEGK